MSFFDDKDKVEAGDIEVGRIVSTEDTYRLERTSGSGEYSHWHTVTEGDFEWCKNFRRSPILPASTRYRILQIRTEVTVVAVK